MKSKLKVSDLELILHLYAPKKYSLYIFDPFGKLEEDKPFDVSRMDDTKPMVLVNLADRIICYKGLPLDSFDIILDFGKSEMPASFKSTQYNFMNNPQGGMRWLYQKGKINTALSFYNTSSIRAKAIAAGLRSINAIGLGVLVSKGSLTISSRETLKLDSLLQSIHHDTYAIFTGTPGYDRTAVIAIENKGKNTHFAKVALNRHGISLLNNENSNLSSSTIKALQTITIPRVETVLDPALLITTNEGASDAKNSGHLTEQHIDALVEMYNTTMNITKINGSPFWNNITSNISFIESDQEMSEIQECGKLLTKLKDEVDTSMRIMTSLAHSDFTPWNTKTMSNTLYVYDWEMAKNNIPALFDLFHFHFQNGIMAQKSSLADIMSEIELACSHQKIKTLITNHKLDIKSYLKLYLLRTASYYLATFIEQGFVSMEQKDQISIWNKAIKSNLSIETVISHRKVFIKDFYPSLLNFKHAVLKFDCGSMDALPETSDLDIALLKKDIPSIILLCKNHRLVMRTNVIRKSFMSIVQIFFKDGSFLSLDLINQFKRKGLEMMEMNPLLNSSHMNKFGVNVPDNSFDLEYAVLFYNLNNAVIPIRYYAHFSRSSQDIMNKGINHLNSRYNLGIKDFQNLFTKNESLRNTLKSSVKKQRFVSLLNQVINPMNYILDTITYFFSNRGFIVTLSGVDGVGKSTIIQEVKRNMELRFRKNVVLLRHRPGILPILSAIRHGSVNEAEKAAGENLPRMGTNKNFLSSLLRFGYYYADYILGQVYVYFKYILRGKIVLYDRYYFDFISDPKRSNIHLNRQLIKSLYLFVFKPRLNILLWAEPKEVYKRKQELKPHTIGRLNVNYKSLFNSFSNRYHNSTYKAIENVQIEQTVSQIMNEFSQVA